MKEYVRFLLFKFIRPHCAAGTQQVHVIFDSPGAMSETPKELEQSRRDKNTSSELSDHECLAYTSIPTKWRSILACRICKKALICYIAIDMLNHATIPFTCTCTRVFLLIFMRWHTVSLKMARD